MTHLGNRWLFYLASMLTAAFVLELIALNGIATDRGSEAVQSSVG
jgi:hypothetical protein